jgi:hypothetical protein
MGFKEARLRPPGSAPLRWSGGSRSWASSKPDWVLSFTLSLALFTLSLALSQRERG